MSGETVLEAGSPVTGLRWSSFRNPTRDAQDASRDPDRDAQDASRNPVRDAQGAPAGENRAGGINPPLQ